MMRIKSFIWLLFGIIWQGVAPAFAQQGSSDEKIFFYHHDHLGNTVCVTDEAGEVVQHVEYLPTGDVFIEEKNPANNYATSYKFNGKELDEETGLYYYGARYLHPKYAMWLSTDPLEGKYPNVSSYCYTMGNPVRYIDPSGMLLKEYDQDGNVISNLGGERYDFKHNSKHDTKVFDNKTGKSIIIKGGEKLIRNYAHRDKNTTLMQLTKEFFTGTGPANSLFVDFSDSGWGPFSSLESPYSIYTSEARHYSIVNSSKGKGHIPISTFLANPLSAGTDLWEQFIGEAGISWYEFGDNILYLLQDSKSNSSALYHTEFFPNHERDERGRGWGNTHQTYIWIESKSQRNERNELMWKKVINMNLLYK